MSDYDVVVVGYGPTGMTLAALLGQRGHRVVVLERYKGLYNLPRAACFDDEIMRTFQKLGLAAEIGRGTVVQRDYDWINANGETLVELEYPNPAPSGWAALHMMFQPHVEDVLDQHIRSLPTVEVRQGVTVTALEEHSGGVTLHGVDALGEAVCVKARYAVGADGGNGFMRRTLCKQVDDYGFQENWLVCDFHMHRAVDGLPMFRQVCDPIQPTSIVRIGPEHHRFSFMLNPGEAAEDATMPSRVWERVSKYLTSGDADLIRAVNYVFRSRVADRWRHGRALLAGDAAHEMPPFLAQGMCSGIRDSHNLAWKLDLVLTGRADDVLLDTYQPEREPHVRFITEKAIELGRVQTLRDPTKARERDERLLARRAAHQAPEKLKFPALGGGLIHANGGLFPQGRVRLNGREGLFDDVVGNGWCIVAQAQDVSAKMTPQQRGLWQALGGMTANVMAPPAPGAVEDLDGTYSAWFESNGCSTAIVRPDWYVYGTANGAEETGVLLDQLAQSLRPRTQAISPAQR